MKGTKLKLLTAVFLLIFCVGANPAFAQKIGYLDLSKIFDEYEKTKQYDTVLEGQHDDFQKEREGKVEKLKEAQSKLALLKDEEKEKLSTDIQQMQDDLVAFEQSKSTDMKKQRDEKIREILLEIEQTVSEYAKKEKYDLILNDRVLIYGSEANDLSEQILAILNDNYNKN